MNMRLSSTGYYLDYWQTRDNIVSHSFFQQTLREKCPNTEYLSVFSLNAGKYGPEKAPYLDTFHAVKVKEKFLLRSCYFYWKKLTKVQLETPKEDKVLFLIF